MCVSFFVSEVADVLDVTSSLAGSFVIYIIPAAFQLKCVEGEPWSAKVMPWIMIGLGAINLVFGFVGTVIRWTGEESTE